MDAELTNRSRDAINAASNRAVTGGHPDLTPAHLLLALLQGQDNENITDLLTAVDADQVAVRTGAERVLAGLPSVTGSTVAPPQPSREMLAVVADAQTRAKDLGDEYLSTEHLLIGIAAKGGAAGEVLKAQGATADKLQEAFRKARGRAPGDHRGPGGPVQGAGEVRHGLHGRRARGQARPGHRPGHRDPPRRAGAVPPYEEQPGADR
ncbi:hypothetical protein Sdagh_65770 [Streptomyces daghestanicus]|uniref:Clp R domain-containing protein n=1 Tax=Streptomyces daghestanicus TaxID=66885 RepID=A0ABQ3QC30_9ACTN|nr:hypothetical protein Sdagh_65770 [Streptomyces daghestanicus]